eukprot:10177-Eustigmatos_ZCMA.PRE.1
MTRTMRDFMGLDELDDGAHTGSTACLHPWLADQIEKGACRGVRGLRTHAYGSYTPEGIANVGVVPID